MPRLLCCLLFAIAAYLVGVVSFPLLLDRDVDFVTAMVTSVRAVVTSPLPMIGWAAVIVILLIVSALPYFLGLLVTLPVLGHATWHLYRQVVVPELNPQPLPPRPHRERRPAADFPANLFPWRRKDGDT